MQPKPNLQDEKIMTDSSTDDREENQEFLNGKVEEMLARLR